MLLLLVVLACGLTCWSGCHKDQQSAQHAPARRSGRLVVDGSLDDWERAKPVLREVGLAGRGMFSGFDVTRLYLKTDSRYLYLFACCEPSVASRFEEDPTTCGLLSMFVNTDGRADTGTPNTTRLWSEGLPGSDCKIVIGSGVSTDLVTRKSKPEAVVMVFRWQNGGFPVEPSWEADSDEATGAAAYGSDGVEIVVPLSVLGLKPGAYVRALVVEDSHFANEDALNEISFGVPRD